MSIKRMKIFPIALFILLLNTNFCFAMRRGETQPLLDGSGAVGVQPRATLPQGQQSPADLYEAGMHILKRHGLKDTTEGFEIPEDKIPSAAKDALPLLNSAYVGGHKPAIPILLAILPKAAHSFDDAARRRNLRQFVTLGEEVLKDPTTPEPKKIALRIEVENARGLIERITAHLRLTSYPGLCLWGSCMILGLGTPMCCEHWTSNCIAGCVAGCVSE